LIANADYDYFYIYNDATICLILTFARLFSGNFSYFRFYRVMLAQSAVMRQ